EISHSFSMSCLPRDALAAYFSYPGSVSYSAQWVSYIPKMKALAVMAFAAFILLSSTTSTPPTWETRRATNTYASTFERFNVKFLGIPISETIFYVLVSISIVLLAIAVAAVIYFVFFRTRRYVGVAHNEPNVAVRMAEIQAAQLHNE
ncbi:hypothetical protein PENTCL1PPCAC_1328, partial [Pristionchus entomophagus]